MINEITIIGPGLIGGSLGLALKSKKICKKIVGIDVSKNNLDNALRINAIDESRKIIDDRIKKSEVIFICTPVSSVDGIIKKIAIHSKKTQIVSDVGSVKKIFSESTLNFVSKKFDLVPAHPIAGTEHSGAINAKTNMFKSKWCVITPIKKNSKSVKTISEIWKKIGMKISIMGIEEHDKIMSVTSHLPHLIAFTIVGTAFNLDIKKKRKLINFAAGGFKDFTRIGSSDPKMWTDIFLKNKEFLIGTLESFLNDIKEIRDLIQKNDGTNIFNLIKRTKKIRKSILKVEGGKKNDQ
ncbi:MAG: prephenate dehydrogenase/arogenate dehydrogenase family protein [Pseudomonadota bacterium]|nr:prephenate dehydrogenase/arogenate dehydrogenase family protein [Pseudomonadota bacterium]